jgi:hypothetical protein
VVDSFEGGRKAYDGSPLKIYLYGGGLELGMSLRPTALTFTYARDAGVLDVHEIVLLPNNAGESEQAP